jgi:hypothetical protein
LTIQSEEHRLSVPSSLEPIVSLTLALVCFGLVGLAFGGLTFSHRHLFSEGHTRPAEPGRAAPALARLAWLTLCTVLWPVMAFTGAMSWWLRRSS